MRHAFAVFVMLVAVGSVFADPKKPTFDDDVLPIFKQYCGNCHGNDKQKGGLNLATFAAAKQGGSSGEAFKPGDPDKSRVYRLTAHKEEPFMPTSGQKIPDSQIEIIRLWIEQGARENSGSKVAMPDKPKVDIGLKGVAKGKPDGPPPMPQEGKLKGDPLLVARRPGAVLALAASPWAPLLAVGGQKQVLLFHTDTGDFLGSLPFDHGQINSLKFSRNGKLLLAAGGRGGASGKAVLFHVETCEKVTEVGIETDALLAADISSDQKLIAVGSPSKLVRIYSTADGSVLHEVKKHTDWVTAVEFSPDGVLLATGDRNGGLFVWEANTAREFHTLRGHTAMITDVSWRGDSNVLASSSEDGTVKLWEMNNGQQIKSWATHGGGAAAVKYSHDGKLASTGRDRLTKLWDENGGLVKQFEAFPDLGLRVAFTTDNAKVIAGDWAGNLKTWAVADAKLVAIADTNPLPFAERLKAIEAAFTAADAKVKATQAAFTDADTKNKAAQAAFATTQATVAQLTADLAAAQKAASDTANALTAANAAVALAKADADKLALTAAQLQMTEQAKAVAATAFGKADAEMQDAATKTPTNAVLAEQAKKAAEIAKTVQAEHDAAKKAVADHATLFKAANDKLAAAQKVASEATVAAGEAQKKVPVLQQELQKAQAAVLTAKTLADQAAAAVAPAKAAFDAATNEFHLAKGKKERLTAKK
jgi:WD40 repeat protein